MHIVFGWNLDGLVFPETIMGASCLGSAVVGPAGLLDLLQTQIGSGFPLVSEAVRTARYLRSLQRLDNGEHFYSRSFAADPWSTTEKVLALRDSLVAGGWNGNFLPVSSPRLSLVASLEQDWKILPGQSDCLRDTIQTMLRGKSLCKWILKVITPISLLPAEWRRLLQHLKAAGALVTQEPIIPIASSCSSDITRLQRYLYEKELSPLQGDGSLVLAEADNELEASEFIASWLKADLAANANLVIIRGTTSSLLDRACSHIGLPRVGGMNRSRWRAITQVLPLAFELCWSPLNPQALLEFLALPRSPLPRGLSKALLAKFRREPGIETRAWREVLEDSIKNRIARLVSQGVEGRKATRIAAINSRDYCAWLDPPRHHPDVGMPCNEALEICRRIAKWATHEAAQSEQPALFHAAKDQAIQLSNVLRELSLELITAPQLSRIMDMILSEGEQLPGAGAEEALWSVVDSPSQVWGPAESILWCAFSDSREAARQQPAFTTNECYALADIGITVESDIGLRWERDAFGYRLPIYNCQQKLLLVQAKKSSGVEMADHPLQHELDPLFANTENIRFQARGIFLSADVQCAGRSLRREPTTARRLPELKPHWKLHPGQLEPPESESASSLERMFGCQLSWLLKHVAKIEPGNQIALPDDETLTGTLAHLIVSTLLTERAVWEAQEATARADELFHVLAEQMAPQLMFPGKALQFERTRILLLRAIGTLISLINNAELEIAGCELPRTGMLGQTKIHGTIDLLLKDKRNRPVVIDLKWTRWHRFKRESLSSGTSVQLATYGWLEGTDTPLESKPAAGYFMLRQAQMYFTQRDLFPDYTYVNGPSLNSVWNSMQDGYRNSLLQLKAGVIDVAGLNKGNATNYGMSIEPPCRICNYSRLCGKAREGDGTD